jgi:hypothetical protein
VAKALGRAFGCCKGPRTSGAKPNGLPLKGFQAVLLAWFPVALDETANAVRVFIFWQQNQFVIMLTKWAPLRGSYGKPVFREFSCHK